MSINIKGIKNLSYWIKQINKAKNKDELKDIRYRYFISDAKDFMDDRINSLSIYKEQILSGATKEELQQAIKSLELPKNITKLIY